MGELSTASPGTVAGVVFLGVGPTAIAFVTWASALARADAGRMAATTLSVPGMTVLLSRSTLGEVPTVRRLVGGALALIGVSISRLRVRSGRAAIGADAGGARRAGATC